MDHADMMDVAWRAVCGRLGLPESFQEEMRTDSDWTFIVKLHALLEGTLAKAVADVVGREELSTLFDDMATNGIASKVAFANAMGLLSPEQNRYIRKLSELRNKLVHGMTHLAFSLDKMVESFDENQFKSYEAAFAVHTPSHVRLSGEKLPRDQFLRRYPRLCILYGGAQVLLLLLAERTKAGLEKELAESREAQLEILNSLFDLNYGQAGDESGLIHPHMSN